MDIFGESAKEKPALWATALGGIESEFIWSSMTADHDLFTANPLPEQRRVSE
ncbi:MAG: hypothetical protein NTW51_09710 [Cyanobacteria bacterium]|nr:hypothetical protein [Cyanobacteriota bacterium]